MRFFVDMDGVLADFPAHHHAVFGEIPGERLDAAGWARVRSIKDFYLNIPPMADMRVLWEYIAKFNPIILTGVPYSVPEAVENKREWVRKHIGEHVEVRCCRAVEKYLHAESRDVLVDDRTHNSHLWVEAGGIWIVHRTAIATIEELKRLGF